MDEDENPCPRGTINHHDADVQQVAAALGDACEADGLSSAYYRKADDALERLAGKIDKGTRETLKLRDDLERVAYQRDEARAELERVTKERDAAVDGRLAELAGSDPTAEARGQLAPVAIQRIRKILRVSSGESTVAAALRVAEKLAQLESLSVTADAIDNVAGALGLERCGECDGSGRRRSAPDGHGFLDEVECRPCGGKGWVRKA